MIAVKIPMAGERKGGGEVNRYTRDSEGKCEGESDQADGDAGESAGDRLGSRVTQTQAIEDPRFYS